MSEKSQIFIIKTSPETVLEDYAKLMHLSEYQKHFPPYLEWAVPQPHNLYLAFWLQYCYG